MPENQNSVNKKIRNFTRVTYDFVFRRPQNLIKVFTDKKYYKSVSYYPNQTYKSTYRIFFEQLKNVLLYGEPNGLYFMNGFDVKGFRRSDDYVPILLFNRKRDTLNGYPENNSIAILRDKLYFGIIAKSFGFKTPENIGILSNGDVLTLGTNQTLGFQSFLLRNEDVKFFLKIINGQQAEGIFSFIYKMGELYVDGKLENVNSFLSLLGKDRYLIQESVLQHNEMNKIYPHSVNTTRIVTVNIKGEVKLFYSFLRLGAHGAVVDNMSRGGLRVDIINDTGQLNSFGICKPGTGTTSEVHPDTNILFSEFIIPYYKEAVHQVMRFHKLLPQVHSIGWDVAITENGPSILEGNDNWGFSLHHDIESQKKKYKKFFN